ncbi:Hsp20/alpha crystallin family protein [Pedobacter immunditicola]|uniref:Hsp20/alpha crystallin family protein n=1 Tax=Pedobacter immunditicola TaxID=3133440 RepID=UPI00309EDEDE
MNLMKYDTRNALSPGLNDIFESLFNDAFISDRMISRVPAVNISETEQGYDIELAAPGLKKEDFKISLDKNVLNISAEKKAEETEQNKKYNRREYSYTSFTRAFTLPETIDENNIEASYHDGVLAIRVARKEPAQMETREININ